VPRWGTVAAEAPELAREALTVLESRRHLVLATIRPDGSPRVSGIEVQFLDDELWVGSMWRSPKALDLRRDPRFALHGGTVDPPEWDGDAKVSGRAVEVDDPLAKQRITAAAGGAPPGPFHLFRLDVEELVLIRVGDPADHLVVRRWTPATGEVTYALR
jgi:hypothetical protein